MNICNWIAVRIVRCNCKKLSVDQLYMLKTVTAAIWIHAEHPKPGWSQGVITGGQFPSQIVEAREERIEEEREGDAGVEW